MQQSTNQPIAIPDQQTDSFVPNPGSTLTSEIPLTNSEIPSNKFSKKTIFILSITIVTILVIVGLLYFILKDKFLPPKSKSKIIETQQTKTVNIPTNSKNNYIAFLSSDPTKKMLFNIYDPDSRQNLQFTNTINNNYDRINIGKWSTDGRYLPIFAYNFNKSNEEGEPLFVFVFDSQDKQIKKIYQSPGNIDKGTLAIWKEALKYGSPWIDNNYLILENNKDTVNKIGKLTYLSINGELKTSEKSISIETSELKNKELNVLYNNPPDQDNPISSIKYNNNLLPFNPGGMVLGIVDNKLAVLKLPKVINLFDASTQKPDTSAIDKEIEDLKKQNLSPLEMQTRTEELSKKYLDLLEPKGKTSIELYDLTTGTLNNSFELANGNWWTDGVIVMSDKKSIIAHQIDKMTTATKERFIKLTPSNNPVLQILVENKLDQGREISDYFRLVNGTPFYLTDDSKWIIAFHENSINSVPQSSDAKIYIRNIETGEEINICSSMCSTFSSYNSNNLEPTN